MGENGGENGSGVPKPPYSFTVAKVENRLALTLNVCKGRTTRFRSHPLCLHPCHDPIRTLSNHILASFGSQIDCSLATRTLREHLSFQASMPGLFDEDDEMDFLCSHRPAGEVHCGGSFSQVEDIMMFWLG